MKDKILMLIIGILIGAILATGGFLICNKSNTKNVPSNIWDKYSKIGNIENTINLELAKSSYKDSILSLRFKNNIPNYITSIKLANNFIEELVNQGFKEEYKTTSKVVYRNNKYRVIIMDEFDYLIVVMVKV